MRDCGQVYPALGLDNTDQGIEPTGGHGEGTELWNPSAEQEMWAEPEQPAPTSLLSLPGCKPQSLFYYFFTQEELV